MYIMTHPDRVTHLSLIEVHTLTSEYFVLSALAGLIVKMLFMLFSILCNGLTMGEYTAYWLPNF